MGLLIFISNDSKCEISKFHSSEDKVFFNIIFKKLIIFFQRLSQSEGLKKCVLYSGKGQ